MAGAPAKILRHAARGALYLGRDRRNPAQPVRKAVHLMGQGPFRTAGAVPEPVRGLCALSHLARPLPARGRALDARTGVDHDADRSRGGGSRACRHQRFRAPGPRRLRSGACRKRRPRSGTDRMTVLSGLAGGKLKDLTLLRQGPLARALEALNGAGRGDAPRRRRGARPRARRGERSISISRPPRRPTKSFAARGRRGSRSR